MCKNNHLKYLPSIPDSLEKIWCDTNKISKIPILPESIKIFSLDENPIYNFYEKYCKNTIVRNTAFPDPNIKIYNNYKKNILNIEKWWLRNRPIRQLKKKLTKKPMKNKKTPKPPWR